MQKESFYHVSVLSVVRFFVSPYQTKNCWIKCSSSKIIRRKKIRHWFLNIQIVEETLQARRVFQYTIHWTKFSLSSKNEAVQSLLATDVNPPHRLTYKHQIRYLKSDENEIYQDISSKSVTVTCYRNLEEKCVVFWLLNFFYVSAGWILLQGGHLIKGTKCVNLIKFCGQSSRQCVLNWDGLRIAIVVKIQMALSNNGCTVK